MIKAALANDAAVRPGEGSKIEQYDRALDAAARHPEWHGPSIRRAVGINPGDATGVRQAREPARPEAPRTLDIRMVLANDAAVRLGEGSKTEQYDRALDAAAGHPQWHDPRRPRRSFAA